MFNFISYFESIARSLWELSHNESNIHFHRISALSELEEFIANSRNIEGYQLLVLDRFSGKFDDSSNSDNLLDRKFHSFYLLKKAKAGDFDDIEDVNDGCLTVARKIISKLFYDKRYNLNGLTDLQRSSFSYTSIGPLAHGYYGLMVTFTTLDAVGITYYNTDWR